MKIAYVPALTAALLVACTSPIVGAECRVGLTECAGQCVDLRRDPRSCGACGNVCPIGIACQDGVCTGLADGGDGRADGGEAGDGGVSDSGHDAGAYIEIPGVVRPFPRPFPTIDEPCELGELRCARACVRPDSDPRHCGGCGVACPSGDLCVEGTCTGECPAPRAMCDGRCTDLRTDIDHCGACGVACETGICEGGVCQAPLAGHVVILGHDYTERRGTMSRLVGNAVFLPRRAAVRVLGYRGGVTDASLEGVRAAIDETAEFLGRPWSETEADELALTLQLADADVLVFYAQPHLEAEQVEGITYAWRTAVGTFLDRGGVLVALVGEGDGTLAMLRSLGITGIGVETPIDVTGALLAVQRPADAVAIGVPLAYRAERSTVRLPMSMSDAIVTDDIGPVVVHAVVTTP